MSTVHVTLPNSLRRHAAVLAAEDGVSLDQFVATALAEKVAVLDADTYIRDRAARGSREKCERVLAKVPDVEPEEHDRLSPNNAP
ncbi:MAG: type II toxin-antitoxin system HicB family antitoxin [Verrucomicrobiota bacterium]|nr:type II toxin-antitoxin system HicB family antitoxin [Verrucomicrobiota bacterium]